MHTSFRTCHSSSSTLSGIHTEASIVPAVAQTRPEEQTSPSPEKAFTSKPQSNRTEAVNSQLTNGCHITNYSHITDLGRTNPPRG